MRTLFKKPGFELIFSLSLIAIMALPPLVFGQDKKDLEIRINNGDTVINGKNIKSLSTGERKQALKDIENLGSLNPARHRMFIRKRGSADTGTKRITIDRFQYNNGDGDREMVERLPFKRDSAGRTFKYRLRRPNGADSTLAFNFRMEGPEPRIEEREWGFNDRHRGPRMAFMRRNTQSFDYTNTGTDGISTHVSFRVTDPMPEKLKEMGGTEKNSLELKDLNLVPEFSSGKTALMFSLPSRTVAEVKLTDHDGKLIWGDKAINGNFRKSFGLGLNGVYFLQVKQAGKVAVKRIVKE
ncbi:MAG TPA: T9SS type A sorting domain-containing protein [Mucilaginibacter sp.]|nr:T9SS type A sorting domain-containing protein [Mucilaginibacter sp.]